MHQIAYIEQKYPTLELIRGRFEDIDVEANAGRFGTIINSESFQYVNLEKAAQLVTKLLAPGGRWLIGSYHPSQQNTFTGRLTPGSFDAVLAMVKRHLSHAPGV